MSNTARDPERDPERDLLRDRLIARLATRLSAITPVEVTPKPESRLAAVAAVVRVRDEPELLFIKRAEAVGDPWSGHVAFPGGRFEAGDASLLETALRETREELAIDLALGGEVLGRLDDLAPSGRGLPPVIVRPFVVHLTTDLPFTPNREVAAAFWVPVSQLQAAESQAEHRIESQGMSQLFPAYRVGAHLIWGLTERIVRQLLPFFEGIEGS